MNNKKWVLYGFVSAAVLIAASCTEAQPKAPSSTPGKTSMRPIYKGARSAPSTPTSSKVPTKQAASSTATNQGHPMEKLFNAQTHVLSNGLRIIVVEDHDVPRVSVGVLFNVGSADDPASLFGLSHMAEHMYFKGTARYPKPDVTVSNLGGSTNAFTSRDCTMFVTDIPARSLSIVLDLEADRLLNAAKISMVEFRKERGAVYEERLMRIDNDPLGLADEHISATLSPLHPYGKEIIGTAQNIRAYRAKDVTNHYRTWYTPGNATLIVVGDVRADDVFAEAERLFGKIPARPTPPRIRYDAYALRWDLQKEVTYTTDKVATTKISFLYNTPHHRSFTSDAEASLDGLAFAAAFEIAVQALFGSWVYDFSRYFINQKQLIFGFHYDLPRSLDPDPFSVSATLRPGVSLEKFRKVFADRLARVLKKGLSREDFDRAKRLILFNFRYELPDSHDAIRTFFTYLAKGIAFDHAVALPQIFKKVTYEQAKAALRVVFGRAPYATVILVPKAEDAKYPDEELNGLVEKGAFPMRFVTEEAAKVFGIKRPRPVPMVTSSGPSAFPSKAQRHAWAKKETFFFSPRKKEDTMKGSILKKDDQTFENGRFQERVRHQEREMRRNMADALEKSRTNAQGKWKTVKGKEVFIPHQRINEF